ncbi:MAG: hypothetical protein ACRDVN_06935 [Jiangellaceae bacterium]
MAATLSACLTTLVACRDDGPAPLEQIASSPQSGVAENGLDERSAEDALGTVLDALQSQDSYHVTGTSAGGGMVDISFVGGTAATGTVGSSSPVTLVALDGRIYVTGDAEFMAENVGADAATRMADKWLLLPADATSDFSIFADGTSFARAVFGEQGRVEMSGVKQVKGVPALGLVFPETGGTLWVSARGAPLPIQFEEKGASGGTGVLTFSAFGVEVAVEAPAAESVVDIEKLPQQ